MIREAEPSEKIEKAVFIYRNVFMAMEHNYLCAVCREESAVINCNTGVLQPCWVCQGKGWELKQSNGWFKRLFRTPTPTERK